MTTILLCAFIAVVIVTAIAFRVANHSEEPTTEGSMWESRVGRGHK